MHIFGAAVNDFFAGDEPSAAGQPAGVASLPPDDAVVLAVESLGAVVAVAMSVLNVPSILDADEPFPLMACATPKSATMMTGIPTP